MTTTTRILAFIAIIAALPAIAQETRVTITPAPTGLPGQITIHPAPAELPIAWRGEQTPTDSQLQTIGRGPQLRAPARLLARVEGNTVDAEPTGDTTWKAGPLTGTITTTQDAPGQLDITITYTGQANLQLLELVFDLAGPIDIAFAGDLQPHPIDLKDEAGTIWTNAAPETGDPAPYRLPGTIERFFLGNGDRGFLLVTSGDGWQIDEGAAAIQLDRDDTGNLTWRVRIANHPVTLNGEKSVNIKLSTMPAAPRPHTARMTLWSKPHTHAIPALSTTDQPFTDHWPISAFRHLAGTHTSTLTQLKTNANTLTTPGASPHLDRLALGRALLHDIGIDATTLAGKVDALTMVKALHDFGYFTADGGTEYLPYWRSHHIARYGESFQAAGPFATTTQDPMARVHTTAFIRQRQDGARQALFIIVNETNAPVREQFYILQPQYLFRTANMQKATTLIAALDYSSMPPDSDWSKKKMVQSAIARGTPEKPTYPNALKDAEDGGFIRQSAATDGVEVYGPIHIPPRSYRLIYAHGDN